MGLQNGLTKSLLYQPRFLSLTLTESDPASLLLEKGLVSNFDVDNVLLCNRDDLLVPVMLDLTPLPLEATGIVCGVADRLAGHTKGDVFASAIDMSYLSTARTGTVVVEERALDHAMEALHIGEHDVLEH